MGMEFCGSLLGCLFVLFERSEQVLGFSVMIHQLIFSVSLAFFRWVAIFLYCNFVLLDGFQRYLYCLGSLVSEYAKEMFTLNVPFHLSAFCYLTHLSLLDLFSCSVFPSIRLSKVVELLIKSSSLKDRLQFEVKNESKCSIKYIQK